MSSRETVHEVEARAALAVDVPTGRGGDLPGAVVDALEGTDVVRSAAVETVGDVDASADGDSLRASVEVAATMHLSSASAAAAAQVTLADAEPVATVYQFERVAGPYEIEAW